MEARFLEKYDELRSLRLGEVAVSADRSKVFVCARGISFNIINGEFPPVSCVVIIDLNNLHDQYIDRKMDTAIKKLVAGDNFIFKI